MKLTGSVLTLLSLMAGLGISGCSDHSIQANVPVAAQLQTLLDNAVAISGGKIPGIVLYASSEGIGTWAGASGLGNIDRGVAIRAHDKFRAGSILKPFVAAVVLQLVEEGRFALDDPVSQLLSKEATGLIPNNDRITLRMLLNHTAGIADWVTATVQAEIAADPHRLWTTDEYLRFSTTQEALFAPGEGWAYSNTDYNLLGLIIDRATGRSWREAVRHRILLPLQLESTDLPEPGDRTIANDHARGYHSVDGKLIDLTGVDPSMAGAAGGHALETTAGDLARFIDALLAGKRFRDPGTLKQMLTFVDTPNEHGFPYYYGLGIDKWAFPNDHILVGHFGGTAGFASAVYRLPDRGITISAALNTMDAEGLFLKVLLPAIEILTAEIAPPSTRDRSSS